MRRRICSCILGILPVQELDQTLHDGRVFLGLLENILSFLLYKFLLSTFLHAISHESIPYLAYWRILAISWTRKIASTCQFGMTFRGWGAWCFYWECFIIGIWWRLQFKFLSLFHWLIFRILFAILFGLVVQLCWLFNLIFAVFYILSLFFLMEDFAVYFLSLQHLYFSICLAVFGKLTLTRI